MLTVLFGVLSGGFFGALAVAVRLALRSGVVPEVGAAAAATIAFAVSGALALASSASLRPGQLWAFLLIGMLVPGASQILFVLAVRDAGPSRAAILFGTAPLISVLIALTLLGEPFHPALVAGTVLVVAGGAALTRERVRPHDFESLGAVLALTCAALFAVRDNLVRFVARSQQPPPLAAAATSLLGAAALLALYVLLVRRRGLAGRLRAAAVPFAPAGVALAGGYVCLLEAFSHGRVSVVAPLNATQSLWAVAFAAVAIRKTEAIGSRLVVAGALIVAGGALIGAVR
ncbi:MAG TPA: DMT family transporter [Gaiellaceae bacterium]|nr:DMT family transporter [Gaiellaceae bacterium]